MAKIELKFTKQEALQAAKWLTVEIRKLDDIASKTGGILQEHTVNAFVEAIVARGDNLTARFICAEFKIPSRPIGICCDLLSVEAKVIEVDALDSKLSWKDVSADLTILETIIEQELKKLN